VAKIDLVFRSIGERTADISLELATKNIRPDAVHIIDNVRPFAEAVNTMLRIEHDADFVVYVDADCLILEDMRPYLDRNTNPYVDCYVSDRFRGRLHCGVHITRMDLVRAMAEVEIPEEDEPYVLRPESRLRNIAMRPRKMTKRFRNFDILHDHFQYYRDVFAKYALRELRSRTDEQRARLDMSLRAWEQESELDFMIARHAVDFAAAAIPHDTPPEQVFNFIAELPEIGAAEIARMGIEEKRDFDLGELDAFRAAQPQHSAFAYHGARKPKVFGLGLSRTGTRSLTKALQIVGWDCVHYPIDPMTFEQLSEADYNLAACKEYDGVTDITVSPFYPQLDKEFPGSKFVLTVRDKDSWLFSCRNHWFGREAFEEDADDEREQHLKIRRLLRAAVYGTYSFDPERFSWVYDQHIANVKAFFADRPEDLLILNVCNGEGWDKLCPFLGRDIPLTPFPHKGNKVSDNVRQLNVFD
jgi:hypothetical protein